MPNCRAPEEYLFFFPTLLCPTLSRSPNTLAYFNCTVAYLSLNWPGVWWSTSLKRLLPNNSPLSNGFWHHSGHGTKIMGEVASTCHCFEVNQMKVTISWPFGISLTAWEKKWRCVPINLVSYPFYCHAFLVVIEFTFCPRVNRHSSHGLHCFHPPNDSSLGFPPQTTSRG